MQGKRVNMPSLVISAKKWSSIGFCVFLISNVTPIYFSKPYFWKDAHSILKNFSAILSLKQYEYSIQKMALQFSSPFAKNFTTVELKNDFLKMEIHNLKKIKLKSCKTLDSDHWIDRSIDSSHVSFVLNPISYISFKSYDTWLLSNQEILVTFFFWYHCC